MVSSSGAIARQLVEQESRVETSQTFDYLLKTSAQTSVESRCRSITEVKRFVRDSMQQLVFTLLVRCYCVQLAVLIGKM